MPKIKFSLILIAILLWSLTGCIVGPDYFKPETEKELPKQFKQHSDPAIIPSAAEIKNWWMVLTTRC